MATLASTKTTLLDVTSRMDPNGKIGAIGELLSQTNPMLQDMPWVEGNLPVGHQVIQRLGLPDVYWRTLNRGVPTSKSSTSKVTESLGLLTARSEIDVEVAALNGNSSAFRLSEGRAFIEAMNQEMQSTVIYGNASSAPNEFTGLAARYSDTTAGNGQNVIDAGAANGQVDCSSIWLITWSPETVFGIYPKGSKAGLSHKDLGEIDAEDSDGYRYRALAEIWDWKCGVAVKDWRYAVRIGAIDTGALTANSSPADLYEYMLRAYFRIPNMKMGQTAYYMNRSVFQYLTLQRRADVVSGGGITFQNVDGVITPYFMGVPIRLVDAITNGESHI
jgi:hypothetical protein